MASLVAPVLRDGVFKRRRPDVPHPAVGQVRGGARALLLRRDPARAKVPAQEGNRLQVRTYSLYIILITIRNSAPVFLYVSVRIYRSTFTVSPAIRII